MSSSVLERVRSYYEDIEQYEEACSEMLVIEPKNHRDKMLQKYLTKKFVEKIEVVQSRLEQLISDNSLAQEIESLKGDPSSTALYAVFYQKFQELKEYNRKFPDAKNTVHEAQTMLSADYYLSALEELKSQWSVEEGLGRFLDLQEVHREYLNLPGIINPDKTPLTYVGYLTILKEQGYVKVPVGVRKSLEYLRYLKNLHGALRSFLVRSNPFMDFDVREEQVKKVFDDEWNRKSFKPLTGEAKFGDEGGEVMTGAALVASLDVECSFKDVEAILPWNLNLDPLSGDWRCVCCNDRVFTKDTVWAMHLKSMKHERNLFRYTERIYEIMREEAIIFDFSAELIDIFEATKENVERRQARAPGEDDTNFDEDNVEVEAKKKRDVHRMKKNYPIDADGTPMPYWMYKLQGLNHKFVCEICGNEAYFGRRAFERHFSDYKHTLGLGCLGLENCKELHEITKIKDAIMMGKRLEKLRQINKWDSQLMEECEDENGVILDRQTFDLLAKQFT